MHGEAVTGGVHNPPTAPDRTAVSSRPVPAVHTRSDRADGGAARGEGGAIGMDANSNGAGWGGGRRRAHIARPVVLAALLLLAAAVVAPVAGGATRGLVNRRRRGGKPAGPKPLPPIKAVNLDRSAIAPSNHTPTPGALNPELISAELTPPRYCYYNLEGELTQPSVRKPKGGPSLQLSRQIAALLAEPRPCMYYTKYCNANVSENVDMNGDCCFGDRWGRAACRIAAPCPRPQVLGMYNDYALNQYYATYDGCRLPSTG